MSSGRTLIAYASIGGSTEEYANAIFSVFKDEYKMQVDLVDLMKNQNPDLMSYRNIVVGSGIRIQRMHSQGARFLEKDFGDRKVVIFVSSLEPKEDVIKKYVDKILEKNRKLAPLNIEVFGGRMRLLGKTSNDNVDVKKAKEWAQKIAKQLTDN
jgi:menaquinone-dependent protoporphyrinogen IX oxidase